MATMYSGSTNEKDAIQNFYIRAPDHAPDPESSLAGNMLYLNYPSSSSYLDAVTGTTQSHQNCIELPVPNSMISQDTSVGPELVSAHVDEHAYNAWRDGRSEMAMQTVCGSVGGSESADDLVRGSVPDDPQLCLRSHLGVINGQNVSLLQSNVPRMQAQGLSLSLSTQLPVPSFQYQPGSTSFSFLGPHQFTSGIAGHCSDENSRAKYINPNPSPYGHSSITTSIPNSKYLKAAQQMLDEIVNVRKALKNKADKSKNGIVSAATTGCKENDGGSRIEGNSSSSNPLSTANPSSELSPSEKQDLQNKVVKLLAMLDEVDRRYKQYYHQMQIVVSSFDARAGCGAARPYTVLALQTISRHFRCLRDAINAQIRTTRKSLGEQDSTSCEGVGISRLRYIDQHLRQQRTMQQFGMMQPHAWRPQRGLPENSVSVLRAWLFEHFLHPYPKDSEKSMLARQAGLTRSQVSNWFINARVRLWKPMIEEMYKEEGGEAEIGSNSSSENASKAREDSGSHADKEDLRSTVAEGCHTSQFNDPSTSGFPNEGNVYGDYTNVKSKEPRQNEEDCNVLQEALAHVHADGRERFMAYQMAELGRYGNSGVSLTLGLQHSDGSLLESHGQQNFMAVRGDELYDEDPTLGAEVTNYDYINIGGRQQRFGSSQLLHDFVA